MTVGSFAPTDQVQAYAGKVKTLEARIAALELAQARPAPWVPFTPAWTNLTVGNAAQTFIKRRHGKMLDIEGMIVLGTMSSVGTDPMMTLPDGAVTHAGGGALTPVGVLSCIAGQVVDGVVRCSAGVTVIRFLYSAVSGSLVVGSTLSATAPFTWATGNSIRFSASIPLA